MFEIPVVMCENGGSVPVRMVIRSSICVAERPLHAPPVCVGVNGWIFGGGEQELKDRVKM